MGASKMRIESPLVLGRGDALLKYPELLDDYDPSLLPPQPYVAVHLFASHPNKSPPMWGLLIQGLRDAGVSAVYVGSEIWVGTELPPILRLHIDVVKRARKFIGTLSVFNAVAQIMEIPSFVLVNRALQEPLIYRYMYQNGAVIAPWNVGKPIEAIYQEAIEWAKG